MSYKTCPDWPALMELAPDLQFKHMTVREAQLPFGGTKATGVGMREMGKTAIDFYSEWKTVYIDYTGKKRDALFY